MVNLKISLLIIKFFLILYTRSQWPPVYPENQPDCPYSRYVALFYQAHAERKKSPEDNWVCEETFEMKLKICVSMFKTFTARKMNSTYEIIGDKENVTKECEEQPVKFLQVDMNDMNDTLVDWFEVNDTDVEWYEPGEMTMPIWMFRCPITKIHLEFPSSANAIPPPEIMQDFFITKGKLDERPIIAVLKNNTAADNLCLKDIWFFNYLNIL